MALQTETPCAVYIASLNPDLLCEICHELAFEPQRTPCGHLFCRACISRAVELYGKCPVDRRPLLLTDLMADAFRARLIDDLAVKCSNAECPWTGTHAAFPAHIQNCDHRVVDCPLASVGCQHRARRIDLRSHLEANLPQHVSACGLALAGIYPEVRVAEAELRLVQRRQDVFLWVPRLTAGAQYSRTFWAHGHPWFAGLEVQPEGDVGVFLFAHEHRLRTAFMLLVFHPDLQRKLEHHVTDWAEDYRGRGWGPRRLTTVSDITRDGYVGADRALSIGIQLLREPFE